jgi:ABC-type antimicrobial peptide transport system permease subunit
MHTMALKLLMLPQHVLSWPGVGRWLGTQMEFVCEIVG